MPFGLTNVGATFQWATDIAFAGEKDRFVVIYLDDITVYSKFDEDHLKHLKQVFEKCIKFGLSLNPKNSCFAFQEGKLLRHIVTKSGICIDLGRVEAIQNIGLPRNTKELQLFWGKIVFLMHFVPQTSIIHVFVYKEV